MLSCHLSRLITKEPYWHHPHTSCSPLMWSHILVWTIRYSSYQTFITPQNWETTPGETYFLKNTSIQWLLPWCSCTSCWMISTSCWMNMSKAKMISSWRPNSIFKIKKHNYEKIMLWRMGQCYVWRVIFLFYPNAWSFFLLSLKFMNMYNGNGLTDALILRNMHKI